MRIRSGYKTFVLLTLLLWLMTSWTGVHGHFCFDGQEPPISPHLDVIGGHEVHTADESHQDIDVAVITGMKVEAEKNVAVLSQALEDANTRLKASQDKVELLSDENKVILQEKAVIQGQFKQLQNSLP